MMVRTILALAALATVAGSAEAALVCHDARHHVIRCAHRPVAHKTVVRKVVVRRPVRPVKRVVLACHDAHGRKIVCKR